MSLRAALRWVLPFVVSAGILGWLLARYDLGDVSSRVGAQQAGRLLIVLLC